MAKKSYFAMPLVISLSTYCLVYNCSVYDESADNFQDLDSDLTTSEKGHSKIKIQHKF